MMSEIELILHKILSSICLFLMAELLGWSMRVHEMDIMVTELLRNFVHHSMVSCHNDNKVLFIDFTASLCLDF